MLGSRWACRARATAWSLPSTPPGPQTPGRAADGVSQGVWAVTSWHKRFTTGFTLEATTHTVEKKRKRHQRGKRATSESAVQTRASSRVSPPTPVRSRSGPHAVTAGSLDLGVPTPPPDSARAPQASFLTLYPHTAPLSAGRQPRARANVDSRADPGDLQLETSPARQG